MTRIALTFIGRDRSGIIAEVTKILYEVGGNIEDTTMTILEGEFAMILIALLPGRNAEVKAKKAFGRLQSKWGLNCFAKEISGEVSKGEKHPSDVTTHIISVAGRDRTGIVYETSRILAKHQLNITDLNSKILGAGKKSVFTMILEVDIPKHFNTKKLEPDWQRLRKRLGLDVSVRPLERLAL